MYCAKACSKGRDTKDSDVVFQTPGTGTGIFTETVLQLPFEYMAALRIAYNAEAEFGKFSDLSLTDYHRRDLTEVHFDAGIPQ
jgi:hypothetical protein